MTSTKDSDSLRVPPGSLGLPLIGETLSFFLDSQFANKRHEKYGPIFKTNILGSPTIFAKGGDVNRFILTNENKYFVNSLPPSTKALIGADSLSTQTGDKHFNRRKILYQAFQPRALAEYATTIQEITHQYLVRWARMGTLTWYPELRNYTFDVACKFLVGLNSASETNLGNLYDSWIAGLFTPSLPLPWTKFGRALSSRKKLLKEIETLILQRQQTLNPGSDALGLLLQAQDDEGNSLPIDELKNQILTLLFGGHGTLTSALASFCLLLAQHPEVLSRCRAEQLQLGTSEKLTQQDLREMKYLDQVLQEVLRLIPPVGGGFRKVIQTCQFNGIEFPEGWSVIYEISFTHLDTSVYTQPELFQPERFNSNQVESHNKPFSYIPFGGGLRECIGKEFARLEMKLFAAQLVQNYDWKLLPSQNLEIEALPIPRPKDNLKVYFKRLKS